MARHSWLALAIVTAALSASGTVASAQDARTPSAPDVHERANAGDYWAQTLLSTLYDTGMHDPSRDPSELPGFAPGSSDGSRGPGYSVNQAVRQDRAEGYEWSILAVSHAPLELLLHLAEQVRDSLARELTPEQITEGEHRAREWQPAHRQPENLLARAEAGEADAQYVVGNRYATGRGLPQDEAEAVAWYRMAAAQGHVPAMLALSGMYSLGRGVFQDKVLAAKWIILAGRRSTAAQRKMYIHALDVDVAGMTADDFREVLRLAREWEAAHPQPDDGR